MLSAHAVRTLARLYAAGVALYGLALLLLVLLLNVAVGGAHGELPAITTVGVILLLLAPVIWRQVAAAMIAAFLVGLSAWFLFGRPTVFLGAFIVIPLVFGALTALCLLAGPRQS
jgi:hypothetical protein